MDGGSNPEKQLGTLSVGVVYRQTHGKRFPPSDSWGIRLHTLVRVGLPVKPRKRTWRPPPLFANRSQAISTTPAVWLGYLTTLILEYNSLIDSGKYDDITVDDVRTYIRNGTVLESIQERACSWVSIRPWSPRERRFDQPILDA